MIYCCSIIPHLEAISFSPSCYQAIVDEFRAQRHKFTYPDGYTERTLDDVILTLAGKYSSTVTLSSVNSIIQALDWCVSAEIPTLCKSIISRVINVHHLESVSALQAPLFPLLPVLRQWSTSNNMI